MRGISVASTTTTTKSAKLMHTNCDKYVNLTLKVKGKFRNRLDRSTIPVNICSFGHSFTTQSICLLFIHVPDIGVYSRSSFWEYHVLCSVSNNTVSCFSNMQQQQQQHQSISSVFCKSILKHNILSVIGQSHVLSHILLLH